MRKVIIVVLLLFLSMTTVNASGIHGEYDGYSIIKVNSNGQELKVEDVPAINYKDRTLVPIYMLRSFGADVVWNPDTYTVDVKGINNQEVKEEAPKEEVHKEKSSNSERLLLRDTYEWLSDTDMAIWMFLVNLQQYTNLDKPQDFVQLVDTDFNNVIKQHTESQRFALQTNENMQMKNNIQEILTNQSKLIEQATQTNNLFKIWSKSSNSSELSSNLQISLLLSLRAAQQQIITMNNYIHGLILEGN